MQLRGHTVRARLGAFVVQELIGQGSMGVVWRGVHVEQGTPVAIKVLAQEALATPGYVHAFDREVEATARLHHPCIVTVFDRGRVSAEAERDSLSALPRDAPFVVMELVDGSTLASPPIPLGWSQVRATLLSLLDGLAHAHARGVVHRDIKLANVLIALASDQRLEVKLTDFGIAHALDRRGQDAEAFRSAGTPATMAPEQIAGRWREQGPWTDLYALGCVAWELATGSRLYTGSSNEVRRQHLESPLPHFAPSLRVPEGFDTWLASLLEKAPSGRFQCAADAASTLRAMERVTTDEAFGSTLQFNLHDVIAHAENATGPSPLDATIGAMTAMVMLTPTREPEPEPTPRELGSQAPACAFVPRSWRCEEAAWDAPLAGAGLGLYGVRPVPMVGRERERDQLWECICSTLSQGSAQAVQVRGGAGVGKSRLVRWITQRAHEVGAAVILEARHSDDRIGERVLSTMVESHLRCQGLARTELLEHLHRVCPQPRPHHGTREELVHDLVRFMAPEDVSHKQEARSQDGSAWRYSVLLRFLAALGDVRPVVIWLDDAHFGSDALRFVRHAIGHDRRHELPVVFLLTVRDDLLEGRPQERGMLQELARLDECDSIDVRPFDTGEHEELVRKTLGLSRSFVAQVVERTAGNPLFAVQLVGDWVQRGLLTPSRDGFVVAPGAELELPDDIHSLWLQRIAQVVEPWGAPAWCALELAAAFGGEVEPELWTYACRHAQAVSDQSFVHDLVRHRLAQWTDQGWMFAHGMARECLERYAREAQRWHGHHGVCAKVLAEHFNPETRGIAGRRGHHLLQAERWDDAVEALVAATAEELAVGSGDDAYQLAQKALLALDHGKTSREDERRGRALLLLARAALVTEDINTADWHVEEFRLEDEQVDWDQLRPMWSFIRARVAQRRGLLRLSLAMSTASADGFIDVGDHAAAGRAHTLESAILMQLGDATAATEAAHKAVGYSHLAGTPDDIGNAMVQQGVAELHTGALEEAQENLHGALGMFDQVGAMAPKVPCYSALASLERERGNLDWAAHYYHQAYALDARLGGHRTRIIATNMALVQIARGDYATASATLTWAKAAFQRAGETVMAGGAAAALVACAAGCEDWAAMTVELEDAERVCEGHGFVHRDIAWPVEHAGNLAHASSRLVLAERAFAFAERQWDALGRPSDAGRARASRRAANQTG